MKLFAEPSVVREQRRDGTVLLRSTEPLGESVPGTGHWLKWWAEQDPTYVLAAERGMDGQWHEISYGAAWEQARAIGQALLDRGLSTERPLLVLSGNSVGHLLVTLGALCVGVPVAPVSEAYSLQSRDHQRLKVIASQLRPGAVYVEDAGVFERALEVFASGLPVLSRSGGPLEHRLDALSRTVVTEEVERAFAAVRAETVAKILFTSGSTGAPKGVVNTHGMLTSNQQMIAQVWPFLAVERPVLVDWLPWSHTFGGNHNVNMVLAHGGTLYIDDGRPTPDLFDRSVSNYRDVAPTIYFNVPAGYGRLIPLLESDSELAEHFFSRLRVVFNAGAALPATLRERLEALVLKVAKQEVAVTGSWGTTETAPAATSAHYSFQDARTIGVPLPGVELKLVAVEEDTYELRVRGSHVTPGYYGRPDLTAAAFDEEGFYRSGDMVSFVDPDDPNAGLMFRGRLAEDFKLSSGTFVHVGAVRTALLSAASVLSDAVIAGENRDEVCALAWLNSAEAKGRFGELPEPDGEVIDHGPLAKYLACVLAEMNAGAGSASRIERLLVMARPPEMDQGEVTDKGYINQRAVLRNRAHLVELLYLRPAPPFVICAAKEVG